MSNKRQKVEEAKATIPFPMKRRPKHILVAGGAGYIGTHTVVELITAGFEVTVVDNLANTTAETINRVETITGTRPHFHLVDLCDLEALTGVFRHHENNMFHAVIHFAGLKSVGESIRQPRRCYHNNLNSTLNLFLLMDKYECRRLIFSSSATVYGNPSLDPSKITEDYPLGGCTNPYGKTKLWIEDICRDMAKSAPGKWRICLLRYFNPFGAHPSGKIGEDPNGIPNNLTPYILQVAVGRRELLSVFGTDYPTPDGTCVRDYVHVVDLALGHLSALENGIFGDAMGQDCDAYNLGTGRGTSVLEMLAAFSKACGKKLPYKAVGRRGGDVPTAVADCSKAWRELRWKSTKTLDEACEDGWRWQQMNPDGYQPTLPSSLQ
jgi:UDP-glucose 4-epimerase